jgi:CheY-like chemotaxis protein
MARPRILVIDDDRVVRDTIRDTLRIDGHEVWTASEGREGLALIDRNPFDVIFCDLLMPTMDGQAFYEEIRRDYPQALKRVVIVTAQAHSPSYARFLREAGAPVLEKPFTLPQIRQVVTRMTGLGKYR